MGGINREITNLNPIRLLIRHPNVQLFYCLVKILIQVIVTLLVTSSTPKRTFLILKQLKIYLQSIMLEERLNGSDLTNIKKKKLISEIEIIKSFPKKHPEECN